MLLALAAPSIAGVTEAHLSAPASAGKLAAEADDDSPACVVQPATRAASATVARNLMIDPFYMRRH
jgi:hypothetical protein